MRGGLLGAHEYHMAKVCQADSISTEDLIVGEIQSDGGIRLKVGLVPVAYRALLIHFFWPSEK
jgi:hypothetical protein